MEGYPEAWVTVPLEGPLAYRDVDYMVSDFFLRPTEFAPAEADDCDGTEGKQAFRCLLCETGWLRSPRSCLEHCRGRKHQRRYDHLVQQQKAWLEEQEVPPSFADENLVEEDDINYFSPFRRWHFGKWEMGLSCRLCGTEAFPDRYAILDHCQTSKQHIFLRNDTLVCRHETTVVQGCHVAYRPHHPEISSNAFLLYRLDSLPSMYRWHVKGALLSYLAAKERATASLASRRFAWYKVWKTLGRYELRYKLSLLECSIWKQHMLDAASSVLEAESITPVARIRDLNDLETALKDRTKDYESYRRNCRLTSPATAILLGVIPFLKEEPQPNERPLGIPEKVLDDGPRRGNIWDRIALQR